VSNITKDGVKDGMEWGAVLAMVLSFDRSHSILWAMLHSLLSWFYVIYFVVTR
jgi:hypothetical protein